MRIGVMTPDLVEGDAVSNDVLGMANALRNAGFETHLSAKRSLGIREAIVPLSELVELLDREDDLLIHHHSIGSPEVLDVVSRLRCRKILKYHNITPPEFYRKLSPSIARVCEAGLAELAPLLAMQPTVWVDSDFNGRDLRQVRPDVRYRILPPFNQVPRLLQALPDARSISPCDDWNTNILVVGRVVPNKNILLAVEAFGAYWNHYNRHARLILVGERHPEYFQQVQDRILALNLAEHVILAGKVSLAQLKAFYLASDLLLTTSSHEGFCLPLVEAMALHLPIVAVPNAAIPDTAGDAARYAAEDPQMLAEAMAETIRDERAREQQLRRGQARFESNYRNEVIEKRFLQLLAEVVPRESESVLYS